MKADELNSFVEDFIEYFQDYIKNAQELYQSPKPEPILEEIKNIVHSIYQDCLMLGLDNLSNFFQAYDEFLSKYGPKANPNVWK